VDWIQLDEDMVQCWCSYEHGNETSGSIKDGISWQAERLGLCSIEWLLPHTQPTKHWRTSVLTHCNCKRQSQSDMFYHSRWAILRLFFARCWATWTADSTNLQRRSRKPKHNGINYECTKNRSEQKQQHVWLAFRRFSARIPTIISQRGFL
jgi:hypothetical protein